MDFFLYSLFTYKIKGKEVRNQKNSITTHIAYHDGSLPSREYAEFQQDGVCLSQVSNKSFNFKVENQAVSLIAWGLETDDTVTVYRARVGSIGQTTWTVSPCGLPVAPSLSVNVARMPYMRCGVPVVLTADNPHVLIDDVGVFFLVYSGGGSAVVEVLPDVISRKCCCKE